MALPTVPPISLLDCANELGITGPVDMNMAGVRALLKARFTNPVDLLAGLGTDNSFNTTGSYVGDYGNGVYTPILNVRTFFTSGQLSTGNTFTITGEIIKGTWIGPGNTPFTASFAYGSAATAQSGGIGNKSMYQQLIYNGADNIQGYLFYSGNSTGSGKTNGQQSLTNITLVL
jgi:hypothetical protein